MKSYIILSFASLLTLPLAAQSVVDGTRFGSTDITGTARYRSMAGAFGALGGDPSAMTDNPAGMGIYRGTSEITFTPNLSFAHTTLDASQETKRRRADSSLSNLSYVLSFKTSSAEHLVNFNIGLGFNHSQGLVRKYKMVQDQSSSSFGAYLANRTNNALLYTGQYDNAGSYMESDASWSNNFIPLSSLYAFDCYALDLPKDANDQAINNQGVVATSDLGYQRLFVKEQNRNDEYNINFSANWDDFIYGGLTVSIADFNSMINTEFNEDETYDYSGNYIQYFNDLETKGTGVNIKAGILIKPTDRWRLGVAVHTPTWYHMKDLYSGYMKTESTKEYSGGETYTFKYRYYSPWEYQISSAWVLGQKALLSLEYDMKNFKSQKFKADYDDDYTTFSDLNSTIKDYTAIQHTFKAGAEYRVTDNFSVRCGYAYKSSPYDKSLMDHPNASRGWTNGYYGDDNTLLFDSSTKPNHTLLDDQHFICAGIGWHNDWFFVDLACTNHIMKELVSAYPTTDALYKYDYDSGEATMTTDPNYGATTGDYSDLKTHLLKWDLSIGFKF